MNNIKSRFTIFVHRGYANSIIGCMLATLLTPTSLKAQTKADIGTNRQPQTCSSRSEPRTGLISAAQAKIYATCEGEGDKIVPSPGKTHFIDISNLKVNPKPRQATHLDIQYFGDAIAKSLVYEIRGSGVLYMCRSLDRFTPRGKNCLATNLKDRGPNNGVGVCFKEPSGNWRCRLSVGSKALPLEYGPPPAN